MKVRLSKKFVLILGGALVLCGASGAAAVLIGTEKILGPSYRELNGLACTTLRTVKIRKNESTWVRKYVTSDAAGDGITRVRTALRVARAVQEKEKADLVQIAMIDKAGPTDRAGMRGRMIGAQVVYIPDLDKVPEGAAAFNYSAFYLDGAPTDKGEFYGMRIDLPLEDVEHLEAKLTDKADCIDPAGMISAGEHGGAAKGGNDEAKLSGHGEADGDGASSGHGEAPAAHGHEADPAEGHGDQMAAKESGGFLSSITGMFSGSKDEAAGGHDAPVEGGYAAAEADGAHDTAEPAGEEHAANAETDDDHGEQSAKAVEAVHAKKTAEPEKPAEEQGFFDQVKGMIFGGSSEQAEDASREEAKAEAGQSAIEPAPEPRTSAEGGKRWSNASEADEIRSEGNGNDIHAEAGPEAADGANEADAAGAAWLEKFRAQSSAPASGVKH
jgi:hypothetical protein